MDASGSIHNIHISSGDLTLAEKLDALPAKPGVYQFKNADGKIIYVGKAQSLRNRVRQYFQKSRTPDPKTDAMVSKVADVELTVTDSEVEALILESNLIKQIKPRYNVLLKDDKSYPYIVITNEQFPRVFVTRRKILGGKYFGPYTDVKSMRFALKTIRDIFMIRSCNDEFTEAAIAKHKYKVCLDYHIKKCEGPCEGFVTREYYQSMIDQVARVLRGKVHSAIDTLQNEMQHFSDELRFEDAAKIRDKIHALSVYEGKQKMVDAREADRDIIAVASKEDDACIVVFKVREGKVIASQHHYLVNVEMTPAANLLEYFLTQHYSDEEDIPTEIVLSDVMDSTNSVEEWLRQKTRTTISIETPQAGEKAKLIAMAKANAQFWLDELAVHRLKRGDFIPHAVQALQRDLRLSAPPRRIECFDISNTQGTDTVASMVVFVDGAPRKSEYRKFKIQSVDGPNDFASMREVVERRYTRVKERGESFPDLIVVDGGKGQLSSAVEVLLHLELHHVPIIGLAKRLEEVFVPRESEALLLPKTSSSLRLLQRVRDEAHRFAITYHRTVRSKRILQTELDLIKGVGKKHAQELLEAFGSVTGVRFATEEQLADVVGQSVATKIMEYFVSSSSEKSHEQHAADAV
ncbi:MAG TPA: excinuclease ABC subunit UvrC [Bacteroidota bacterium]|nr:excinuclease ABC subunit UvrC [Bacteroidota bacterium]